MSAFYFGCWKDKGHHWWMRNPVGRGLTFAHANAPYRLRDLIDQTFAPPLGDGHQDGLAQLVHLSTGAAGPVTVLAFWDNTVDSRPGSNSAFVFTRQRLTFEDAVTEARLCFPEIMTRFPFPLTEYRASRSAA